MTLRILDRLLLFIAALVVLGMAMGLAFFLVSLGSGEPLQTTLAMRWSEPPLHEVLLRGSGVAVGTLTLDHATLNVRAGGALYRIGQAADIGLVGILWLFVVLSARRLVDRIAKGTPFSPQSVKWLRAIGWSLIALNIWSWIRLILLPLALLPGLVVRDGSGLYSAVASGIAGPAAQVDASLSFALLICGLLVIALAEAFRIGGDLRAENEAFV